MTDSFAADDVLKVARRVLETEAEAVRALVDRLDHRFEQAVTLVETCRGRVVVTGMGKSGLVGKKLAATLAATGTPALFLHPAEGVHGDLGMLVRGDLVVALSHSGETEELLALVPAIKRLAVPLVRADGTARLAARAARRAGPRRLGPRGGVPHEPHAHLVDRCRARPGGRPRDRRSHAPRARARRHGTTPPRRRHRPGPGTRGRADAPGGRGAGRHGIGASRGGHPGDERRSGSAAPGWWTPQAA